MPIEAFSVVAAVNSAEILRENLSASPEIVRRTGIELLMQQGFPSASQAYNAALDAVTNDIVVFVHQDVFLPDGWFANLGQQIQRLEAEGHRWGVLGSFGSTATAHGGLGRVYTTGLGLHGNALTQPQPVESLDEIVLVLRKSSGLRFDDALPHFHMYGTDICMIARDAGFANYAIPGATCVHNTNQLLRLPPEFFTCYKYIRRKWAKFLPIHTACLRVSRFGEDACWRRLQEIRDGLRGHRSPLRRIPDPRAVLRAPESAHAARRER